MISSRRPRTARTPGRSAPSPNRECDRMSETEYDLQPSDHDLQPLDPEPIRHVPGQPLPRLWKTEPDPEEESDEAIEESGKKNKSAKAKDATAPKPAIKPAKPKKKIDDATKG